MRQISETFAARLAEGDTTLCACWRFTRDDGVVFGATDHDRPLSFDDTIFEPAAGLDGVTLETSVGLAPAQATGNGVLSLEFLAAADIDAGLWDGCRVDVWRVDWRALEHRIAIWSGRLSEITRQGEAFAAELVSLKADLERPIGRVYGRACDADVGDERCGFDLGAEGFHGEGVVSAVAGPKSFVASGLIGFDDEWFAGGRLTWASGANSGSSVRIVQCHGAMMQIANAPRYAILVDDAFVVTAGCDKSFATCGAKFANRANFRGFPHMPGADAVLTGPVSDRVNDGGRRR